MQKLHVIKVKYLGATNTKGSRIKITSERFGQSIIRDYNHQYNNAIDNGIAILTGIGFNVIAKGEGKDCMYVISDTFKPFK